MDNRHLEKASLNLQKSFLLLKTKREVFSFLRDLLTPDEIMEFSLRLSIAQKLSKGEQYKMIEESTGASSTTIARVAKYLKGEMGGYRRVLK
ncbi:MAG: YerC/YecD family TrpR-related protein [candidate division SR1 bacterium]|nr:YerC/YecD family TrpR-related protein [candidate division SR1 bacterium]